MDHKEYEYNNKFGAADVETYASLKKGEDGKQICYAAGFVDYKKNLKMFYTREGDANYMVMLRMIEELLQARHNGCSFYIHNMARFDHKFILEALGVMPDVNVVL